MAADFTTKNMGTKNKIITDSSVGIGLNTSATDSNTNATNKNASAKDLKAQAESKAKASAVANADALKKQTESFDTSMDSLSDYSKLMQQYNTDGHFSASSIKEIMDKHAELAPYLTNEEALYGKLSDGMKNTEKSATDAYEGILFLDKNFVVTVSQNSEFMNKLKSEGYKTDFAKAENVAKAKVALESETIKLIAGQWANYFDAQGKFQMDDFMLKNGAPNENGAHEVLNEAQTAQWNKLVQMQKDIATRNKENADSLRALEPKVDFGKLATEESTGATKADTSADTENASAKADQTEASKALIKANKELAAATKQATNSEKDFQSALKQLNITMSLLDVSQEKLEEHSQAYRDGMKQKAKLIQNEIEFNKETN